MKIKFPFIIDIAYNNATQFHNPLTNKDEEIPPDWSGVISPYPDAVICKASENNFEDFTFGSNWVQLGARGTPRAAYHYFRNNDYNSAGAQAKLFVNIINKYGGIKKGDRLIGDFEEEGLMSASKTIDFIYNVELLTGIRPIIYSRRRLLEGMSLIKLTPAQHQYILDTNVWVAGEFDDPNQVDNFDSPPQIFIPDKSRFGKVVLWQYALDVNALVDSTPIVKGIPGGLDFDWGEPDFFAQWKAETEGSIIIPPIDPGNGGNMNYNFQVTPAGASSVNLRADHSVSSADVGDLLVGQKAYGNETWGDGAGEYWLHAIVVNGDPKDCWIAVRHLNSPITTITQLAPVDPAPPVGDPTYITLHYIQPDGSDIQKKYIPE